jgi:ABC-type multidrug transport system ATPase subunit
MIDRRIPLRAFRLTKRYGNRCVLFNIDLVAGAGEIVAILGTNGSGKSTLLRCLAAAARPTQGEVLWYGCASRSRTQLRRLVGLATHECQLFPFQTARENLVFAARMCDVEKPQRKADEWLQRAGLQRHSTTTPRQLSRGMRQRLSLVRALLHDPYIVLLDEPLSGLDREATEWLFQTLFQMRRQGRCICLTAHEPEAIDRLADRAVALEHAQCHEVLGTQASGRVHRNVPSVGVVER